MGQHLGVTGLPPGRQQSALLDSVVALEVPSPDGEPLMGTGFFVAPGVVATCAHVVAASAAELPRRIVGRIASRSLVLELQACPERYFLTPGDGLDLAFLQVIDADRRESPAALPLSDRLAVGDALWTHGHPSGMFRAGQSATFTYEGTSARAFERPNSLHRLRGTVVTAGFSGSPVLNRRTGCVAGMLTTADRTGSSHMVGARELTVRLDPGWCDSRWSTDCRTWLGTLSDAQIEAGGWPFLGPRLREFLDISARAAREHPYPGVVPGTVPPPLSTVYVHQHAAAYRGLAPVPDDEARSPADGLLDHPDDVIVFGGPGFGKSSLLRSWITTVARRWTEEHFYHSVPVLVRAADLVGDRPFASLLHDAVSRELSGAGLVRPIREDLFAAPPAPGVRWLLLVDGLDEVMSPEGRQRVLGKLASIREQDAYAHQFRFVLATRPTLDVRDLPEPRFRCCSLLPFDLQQLPGFARAWFTALGLPEPEARTTAFLDHVRIPSVRHLATVPLMATMLCQLHADSGQEPLPRGRWALYTRFMDLLRAKQYGERANVLEQAHAVLDRHGAEGARAAEGLGALTDHVLRELALAKYRGDITPERQLIERWTGHLRPASLCRERWSALCEEILLRGGLVVRRGGSLEFVHQTLLEHLAAQATVGNPERNRTAYRSIIGGWPRRRRVAPLAAAESPYVDFLVSSWSGRPGFARLLAHWARELHGAQYVARLSSEGAALPRRVLRVAKGELFAVVRDERRDPFDRLRAARALVDLGDARGTAEISSFAALPTHDLGSRLHAAEMLADLGAADAHELPVSVAGDEEADAGRRIRAAEILGRLGDERGARALADLARSSETWWVDRLRAAECLDRTAPDSAVAILLGIAADGPALPHVRSAAVEALSRLHPHFAFRYLREAAGDRERPVSSRSRALEALEWLGGKESIECLARVAQDPSENRLLRLSAADGLSRLRDPRVVDTLAHLLTGPSDEPALILRAAEALARHGDPRAADALAAIAATERLTGPERLQAGRALLSLSDPRGREVLHALTGDPAAGTGLRLQAAEALDDVRDSRALYPLTVIALHPSAPRVSQIRAAERLDQFRTRKAADALLSVLDNPELLEEMRVRAGTLLADLGDGRARRCLERLTRSAFGPEARIRAAGALGKIAPKEGCRALEELLTDASVDEDSRVRALEVLCRAHPERAREVLTDLAADARQATAVQLRALALTRGRLLPETSAAHRAIAAARHASPMVRVGAVRVLQHLGGADVLDLLGQLAREPHRYIQTKVLITLAQMQHAPAAAAARDFVSDPNVPMRNKFEVLQALAGSPDGELRRVVRDVSLGAVPSDLLRDHCSALLATARRPGSRPADTD
ncbi:HEAT repeat domain-containing protein [Streptomyces caniferus]|uniref:HEAT repeat domain-containing protein n=1 Tax=Streptomyces caniferus TaxID=285557 RepID=UPI00135771EA|nr:HEAT repeat domain-containing protein [Streptomyces caniferus]